jgi:hypothetical protein
MRALVVISESVSLMNQRLHWPAHANATTPITDPAIPTIQDTPYRKSFGSSCGTQCIVIMLCIVRYGIFGLQAIVDLMSSTNLLPFARRNDTALSVIGNVKKLIGRMRKIHD